MALSIVLPNLENMRSVSISLRLANPADSEFAYEVLCRTIRPYAEQTFGLWQEAQVRNMLASNISAGVTKIVVAGIEPVGILSVRELEDHLQLEQIFLLPGCQGNGIGTELVREILLRAKQLQVPVRLRVLRVNPAKRLYERMGFFVTAEEPQRFYMQSGPNQSFPERSTQ
jgi:ribosomal protein S18 acetylase RimI-like enzyme